MDGSKSNQINHRHSSDMLPQMSQRVYHARSNMVTEGQVWRTEVAINLQPSGPKVLFCLRVSSTPEDYGLSETAALCLGGIAKTYLEAFCKHFSSSLGSTKREDWSQERATIAVSCLRAIPTATRW